MTVSRRGISTATTQNGWATAGAKGVTIPVEAAAGDTLLLHWAGGGSDGPVTDPVSLGWEEVQRATSANVTGILYSKIATSTDAGARLLDEAQTAQRIAVQVVAYAGVDATAPIAVSAEAVETTSSTTHAAASITTAAAGWLVRFLALRDAGTRSLSWTPPASVTSRSAINTGNTTFGVVSVIADSGADVAASTYTGNWTVDQASNAAVGIAVSLKTDAGSATPGVTRFRLDASGVWVAQVSSIIT